MAQTDKRENSVLFALRDLRQIEENRVEEEQLAVRTAEEARRRAQEEEERRRREEEEARIRAERDHHARIEEARVSAEREARMRVEAAESAERARQQAALEQQRLQQEMELRRAEVAKKRPTWMLVVTGIAVVGAVALIWFAVQKMDESNTSKQKELQAQKVAEEAKKNSEEAAAAVAKLQNDFFELSKSLESAQHAVDTAQGDADRAAANAKLAQLKRERLEMEQRIADARAKAELAKRRAGVKVRQECLDNALAKGC